METLRHVLKTVDLRSAATALAFIMAASVVITSGALAYAEISLLLWLVSQVMKVALYPVSALLDSLFPFDSRNWKLA